MLKQVFGISVVAWFTYQTISYLGHHDINYDVLRGKNVVITGASSGIGEQMAYVYAKSGANVFITARRRELLQKVISRCQELSPSAAKHGYISADMSKEHDRIKLVESAMEHFKGDLDQLILNHARMDVINVWSEMSTEDHVSVLRDILETNFMSFVHLTSLSFSSLSRRNGSIGVTSSLAGRLPVPYMLEYSSSKFSIDSYFSGLRADWRLQKINISVTVNIIGLIGTDRAFVVADKILGIFGEAVSGLTAKILLNAATPESTARGIISATTRREGELYYPPSQLLRIFVILRHLIPNFSDYLY